MCALRCFGSPKTEYIFIYYDGFNDLPLIQDKFNMEGFIQLSCRSFIVTFKKIYTREYTY